MLLATDCHENISRTHNKNFPGPAWGTTCYIIRGICFQEICNPSLASYYYRPRYLTSSQATKYITKKTGFITTRKKAQDQQTGSEGIMEPSEKKTKKRVQRIMPNTPDEIFGKDQVHNWYRSYRVRRNRLMVRLELGMVVVSLLTSTRLQCPVQIFTTAHTLYMCIHQTLTNVNFVFPYPFLLPIVHILCSLSSEQARPPHRVLVLCHLHIHPRLQLLLNVFVGVTYLAEGKASQPQAQPPPWLLFPG